MNELWWVVAQLYDSYGFLTKRKNAVYFVFIHNQWVDTAPISHCTVESHKEEYLGGKNRKKAIEDHK